MSIFAKFSKYRKKVNADYQQHKDKQVTNFMDGISYRINPLDTLRMLMGSSIFGEPSYYRKSHDVQPQIKQFVPEDVFYISPEKSATEIMIEAVDAALETDFKQTLLLAKELRKTYYMRLNPALIVVRAAMHPQRVEFNQQNGNFFRETTQSIILRPDDITNQFDLFMFFNGQKNGLPSLLKRIWSDRLQQFSRYQLNKYKSRGIIDLIRISHANNELIDELMQTGKITVSQKEKTWQNLRSEGMTWSDILQATYLPHMALLRNLRGIFNEYETPSLTKEEAEAILAQLNKGVGSSKQFPFRYFTAYQEIEKAEVKYKSTVLDTLEDCLDAAIENFPFLKGKTICLSDNSGSAWGTIPSEYGSVRVAEIANLSSIITALRSEEGYVGVFGDALDVRGVSQRNGILSQLRETNERGGKQGAATENGIWLFFSRAITKREKYDNIFIYSDMQAGHGGLYGTNPKEYKNYLYGEKGRYIDVLKLLLEYRNTVNPDVNVFSVQVAGYNNSVLPENLYRTSILTGWTGKEVVYAKELIQYWNKLRN